MPYKTIKQEYPEYKHESVMHEQREKQKKYDKEDTKHILGDKHKEEEYDL